MVLVAGASACFFAHSSVELANGLAIERTIQDIRTLLSEQPIETASGARWVPGFSFGLAKFPEVGTSLEALMDIADQRMYAMKPGVR